MENTTKTQKGKRGRPKKEVSRTKKRREELLELIEKIGIKGLPTEALAKQHNVCRRVVYEDIAIIKRTYDVDLQSRQIDINVGLSQSLRVQTKILMDSNESSDNKIRASAAMSRTVKAITEFLEAFGYKEKVAERLEHLGAVVNLNINSESNAYPVLNPALLKPAKKEADKDDDLID